MNRALAFDLADDLAATGRFVIVDNFEISGGGIVRAAVPDGQSSARDQVLRRNLNWAAGGVGEERRAERYSQRAALVLVTGDRETDRKRFGRELEGRLFEDGRFVYFLAIANLLYGVDADLDRMHEHRAEHLRRFSEVANILLGAGLDCDRDGDRRDSGGDRLDRDRGRKRPGVVHLDGRRREHGFTARSCRDRARRRSRRRRARQSPVAGKRSDLPAMVTEPQPAVLWFTGLSGAGKSTISAAVEAELRLRGTPTEYLDGDAVRAMSPTGFTRADRDAHVRRVGFLASRLEHHGVTVVCALISPYAEARQYVRSLCQRFIEIHVSTPLEECERRDRKGLYARARRGEITHFTGIDDPYESPVNPELAIDTTQLTVEDAVTLVMSAWVGEEAPVAVASSAERG